MKRLTQFLMIQLLVLAVAAGGPLSTNAQESVKLIGYEIEFLDDVNNGDGTQTWSYRVTETSDADQDLSHWVLGLCVGEDDVDWLPEVSDQGIDEVEIGKDPQTKVDGIKWGTENDFDKDNQDTRDSREFSFTVNDVYGVGTVDVGIKTGTAGSRTNMIKGPDCSPQCLESDFEEKLNKKESRVEVTVTDPEGIESISFTDADGNPVLNNLDVELSEANGDFSRETSGNDISWSAGQTVPTKVVMYLNQADPNVSTFGYFLRTENGCGTETVIDPTHTLPAPVDELTLQGNYPNPFSEETTIGFALPQATEVTLSVYDVTGRKVATLKRGRLSSGVHEVRWDGHDQSGARLASGLYLVRLTAGSKTLTSRVTLVR